MKLEDWRLTGFHFLQLQISQDKRTKNWVLVQNQTLAVITYDGSLVITEPPTQNAVWFNTPMPLWIIVQSGGGNSANVPVR